MREFELAAKEASEVGEMLPSARPVEFKMNGRVIKAHPPANSGPIGYLMAMQSRDADPSEQAYAVLTFITSLMEEEDSAWVRRGLATGEVDFDLLFEVFQWLVEEWSARPTSSPQDSSMRR
jgi:hypothetical protein